MDGDVKRGKDLDLSMEPPRGWEPISSREEVAQTSPQEDDALLIEFRRRLGEGASWWRQNFDDAREDVEFAYGEQWEESAIAMRGADRPALTFNNLPQYINRLIGAARQSKFGIQVHQTSGLTDKQLSIGPTPAEYSRSEIMEGLIRDIEVRSNAHRAYCRAGQHAIEGGFGWLKVRIVRDITNPFTSELRIDLVKDRWSVLIDPYAEADDFSDAMWCCESSKMTVEEYKSRYPESGLAGMGTAWLEHVHQEHDGWWGQSNEVRVADYWWKEPMERVAIRFVHVQAPEMIVYEDEVSKVLDELHTMGYVEKDRKKVNVYKVKYMRANYMEALEGPYDWPSVHLPIVPVLGREINKDSGKRYAGLIRWAHDPQRAHNYWITAVTERVALAPRAPWIATAEQLAGRETDWKEQNLKNTSVLLYNHQDQVNPPQRTEPATMPTAEMMIVDRTRAALMDVLGMHEASIGQRSNETSGVAIERRQNESDAMTFEFVDNMAHSIRRVGQILIDMIPKMYTGEMVAKLRLADDTEASVHLNQVIVDGETGIAVRLGSLDFGRYDCVVDVGPAHSTLRREFVQTIQEIGRSNPQLMSVFADLFVSALDVPNSRELARRAKFLVPPQMLSEEDRASMPPPEPSPEQQQMQMEMEKEKMKGQFEIEKEKIQLEREKVKLQQAEINLKLTTEHGMQKVEQAEQKDDDDDKEFESKVKEVLAQDRASR